MRKLSLVVLTTIAVAGSVGCGSDDSEITKTATALIAPTGASGPMGTARFEQKGTTTTLTLDLLGLTPGTMHGFHIHAGTSCDPDMAGVPAGMAGGHWNPTMAKHGAPGTGHLGDVGNIMAMSDGKGQLKHTSTKWTIGTNDPNTDVVGHAVIVHAMADDLATDPTGNSGGRVACGIVR